VGELHIADFGPPDTRWGQWGVPLTRRFEPMPENLACLLPVMLREAGFEDVEEAARFAAIQAGRSGDRLTR